MQFDYEGQTAIFDYWLALKGDAIMPSATAFSPMAVARWLPDIAIMELRSADEILYRLAGTRVVERLGHDPTGVNLLSLIPPERRAWTSSLLWRVIDTPSVLLAKYVNHYASGRIANLQSLYLPLTPPEGRPPRLISLHVQETVLSYKELLPVTTIAAEIRELLWIDIGAGMPQTPAAP